MAGTFQLAKTEVGRLNHFMLKSIEAYKVATAWGKLCKTERWLSDITEPLHPAKFVYINN